MTRLFATRRAALLGLLLGAHGALRAEAAAAWPGRLLRVIVGFPAGSSPDLTARALAGPLEKALGQPVIVENRVGASGNIGADVVARAADGHTVGLMINGNLTIAKLLNPAVRYDPLTDLAPVSLIGVAPLVLVASLGVQAADGRGFFAAARAAGEQWSYGSPGVGTVGHLGMELLKKRSGIAPVHVPYAGYPQVAGALMAGDLQLSMLPPALAVEQIAAGKLRGIGVTSSGRSALAPGLPSLAEAGVPDFNLEIWNAMAAPAAMPRAHIDKLAAAVGAIVREPRMRERLFQQGWQAAGSSPEELRRRMRADAQALGAIIREQGIRGE